MSRANKRWFHKRTLFQRRGTTWGNASIRGNMFSKKKTNLEKNIYIVAALLLIALSGVCVYQYRDRNIQEKQKIEVAKVDIQIEDIIIYQNEALPKANTVVTCEKENEYVSEFLVGLKAGVGYQIEAKGDLSQEGEYELSLTWDREIAKKIAGEWKDIIDINVQPGTVNVKSQIEAEKPMIALTFDDGPGAYTEELLSVLEENGARATFFVLGQQVDDFPTAVKKMKELNCEIGNHTYAHKRLTELSKKDMLSQINKTNEVLKEVIGEETQLVRPTYGTVNASVRENVKYPLIMWSLDTEDWKIKDADKIAKVILSEVKDGDIVLMHDIHDFTLEAMKTVIPKLVEEGYQLVTVSELANAHGITMKSGEKYFKF